MQHFTEYELTTSRQLAEPLLHRELERRRIAAERHGEAGALAPSRGAFARLLAWTTRRKRGEVERVEQTSTGSFPLPGGAR